MQKRDTLDVEISVLAAIGDACAVFAGIMLATWIRFDSGWVPVFLGRDPHLYAKYGAGASITMLLFLLVFHSLGLYVRPQLGSFESKIPRLVRACGVGLVGAVVLAFVVKNLVSYSSMVLALSFATVTALVVLERYILFRIELHFLRHSPVSNRALILGTGEVAAHLKGALEREPGLRTRVVGFLRVDEAEPDPGVPRELVRGRLDDLARIVPEDGEPDVDQVILTHSGLDHGRMVDIILFCERNLLTFNMVPDLFRILTGSMGMQSIDGVPLLGVVRWPLDYFWNRLLKRLEDLAGAAAGLVLTAPVVALAALLIRRESEGPAFYVQERCGESGKTFRLYKLRTMRTDAEAESGPVFTKENDPRTTRVGAVLRRWNIDELPQLWNVLRGDMSLVGPRPERPHFVERFKTDISRYMWRHVSKPGVTGWAQVNGLRGNTSIEQRIKYDLYYLEHWSLFFDLRIILRTLQARKNAY